MNEFIFLKNLYNITTILYEKNEMKNFVENAHLFNQNKIKQEMVRVMNHILTCQQIPKMIHFFVNH